MTAGQYGPRPGPLRQDDLGMWNDVSAVSINSSWAREFYRVYLLKQYLLRMLTCSSVNWGLLLLANHRRFKHKFGISIGAIHGNVTFASISNRVSTGWKTGGTELCRRSCPAKETLVRMASYSIVVRQDFASIPQGCHGAIRVKVPDVQCTATAGEKGRNLKP